MNDNWINKSIAEYYNWLRDRTQVFKDEQTGWYTITTPFLGLFNDNIEIYAKLNNGRIILSDDGVVEAWAEHGDEDNGEQ